MAELLPDGVGDLRDAPHVLFDAVRGALLILSFGELPKDERPPRSIWLNGDKLEAWFEQVERNRNERSRGDGPGPIEDPVDNQAARSLIVG